MERVVSRDIQLDLEDSAVGSMLLRRWELVRYTQIELLRSALSTRRGLWRAQVYVLEQAGNAGLHLD